MDYIHNYFNTLEEQNFQGLGLLFLPRILTFWRANAFSYIAKNLEYRIKNSKFSWKKEHVFQVSRNDAHDISNSQSLYLNSNCNNSNPVRAFVKSQRSHGSNQMIGSFFSSIFFGRKNKMNTLTKKPIGTTATTGQKCPGSGVWEVVGTPSTTAPIAKGNTMPPYGGKGVSWKLIQHA